VRGEVAVMKAIAVRYVMNREGAEAEYARQREQIAELYHALVLDGGRSLEAWLKPSFDSAHTDGERNRVIVDQIASLTDVSIVDWHARLVRH
jgi:dGTPase